MIDHETAAVARAFGAFLAGGSCPPRLAERLAREFAALLAANPEADELFLIGARDGAGARRLTITSAPGGDRDPCLLPVRRWREAWRAMLANELAGAAPATARVQ